MKKPILFCFFAVFFAASNTYACGWQNAVAGRCKQGNSPLSSRRSNDGPVSPQLVEHATKTINRKSVNSTSCVTDEGNSCDLMEQEWVENVGENNVMNKVNEVGGLAVQQQSATCSAQKENFDRECDQARLQTLRDDIIEIENKIKSQTEMLANIKTESEKPVMRANKSVIQKIFDTANELKLSISTQTELLANKDAEIQQFEKFCTTEFTTVQTLCTEPTFSTNGDSIVISLITPEQSTVTRVDAVDVIESNTIHATVKVEASGVFEAPEIKQTANSALTYYTVTTGSHIPVTRGALTTATETLTTSENLATEIIRTLTPLIAENITEQSAEECSALQRARNACGTPPSSADGILGLRTTDPNSYALGTVVEGSGDGGTGARGKTSPGGGSTGGVTADQASQDAGNMAYGAPGSGGDTGSNTGAQTGAGNGSAAGGLGSVMGGLGTLGSVFGKTGGGYGADSSYGATRSNLRGGSNNGGSTGGFTTKSNGGNSGYNYKSGANNKGQPNDGNSPNQNSFNPGQGYGNYGAGMPGMGGGNAGSNMGRGSSGNSNNEKPGFLSRMLGRQKDKTLFGKRSGGGSGGGSFGNTSRSGLGSNSPMGSSINDKAGTNNNARVFDASKYAPSKAAQDRAYARATGRKIASHVSDTSNSPTFEWPRDISRDKNSNLFRSAGLSVRVNLSK